MKTTTGERFRFGLGHVTLEFLATLAGRFGEPADRLRDPADLSRWLDQAGLAPATRCDERLLADARALREAIYDVLDHARRGTRPRRADLDLINAWARRPGLTPQLGPGLIRAASGPVPAEAALAQLARVSVEFVTSHDPARIRNCADPRCSLLFVDRSRPGRRRWCSMERCGNRSKTARYRRRTRRAERLTAAAAGSACGST
jgi:predicted RNA-binding Zn ribbon-like protein